LGGGAHVNLQGRLSIKKRWKCNKNLLAKFTVRRVTETGKREQWKQRQKAGKFSNTRERENRGRSLTSGGRMH